MLKKISHIFKASRKEESSCCYTEQPTFVDIEKDLLKQNGY